MSEMFFCFDCLASFSFEVDHSKLTSEEWAIIKNICPECEEKLFFKKKQEVELNNLPSLKSVYRQKLKKLKQDTENQPLNPSEEQKLNNDIENLKAEVSQLSIEVNQSELHLSELLTEHQKLISKEAELFGQFNESDNNFLIEERRMHIDLIQKNDYLSQVQKHSASHILSDLFVITFSGKYPTINGKRIGERILEAKDIRDNETNAGLGYIMWLTVILAYKFGYTSSKYELIAGNNLSGIKVKDSDTVYELVIPPGVKTFEKFNEAARAYLDYFADFYDHLIKTKQIMPTKLDLDLIINKDCINMKSILLDINKLQDWTQCMKSLLTALKYLITQVIIIEDNQHKKIIETTTVVDLDTSK